MDKYECTVCGYVYDPEEGDPDNDIEAGIPFEDLPDDWVCPVCGALKEQFEKSQALHQAFPNFIKNINNSINTMENELLFSFEYVQKNY